MQKCPCEKQAETGVMCVQAIECQGLPAATKNQERCENDTVSEPPEGTKSHRHPEL